MSKTWKGRFLAPVFALALVACGGGGGGSPEASPQTPAPTSPVAPPLPSLIPPPPVAGDILLVDAQKLRPMKAGAVWTYEGSESLRDKAGAELSPAKPYISTVTQAPGSGQVMLESASNALNDGPDVLELSVSTSSTSASSKLVLDSTQAPLSVPTFKLLSPVRANEQYTLAELDIKDIGQDLDGDGKKESAKLAIYATVAGKETIELRHFGKRTAIRVDTVTRIRVLPSMANAPAVPVIESTEKAWYVEGVGLVRKTVDLPGNTADQREFFEEQLSTHSSSDSGLGFEVAEHRLRVPGDSPLFPGELLGGYIDGAYAFKSHALLLGGSYGLQPVQGSFVTTLDTKGQITRVQHHPSVSTYGVKIGHEAGITVLNGLSEYGHWNLFNLNSDGGLIEATPTPAINLVGSKLLASADRPYGAVSGNTLWLLWTRRYVESWHSGRFSHELVLQAFDLHSAAPLGPEAILETAPSTWSDIRYLAVSKGRLYVLWRGMRDPNNGQTDALLAVVDSPSASPRIRTLSSGASNSKFQFKLHGLESGAVLELNRLEASPTDSSKSVPPSLVYLDETGAPLIPSGTSLLDTILPTPIADTGFKVRAGSRKKLVLFGDVPGSLKQDSNVTGQHFSEIRILPSDGVAFKESDLQVYRLMDLVPDNIKHLLVFEKSILMLRESGGLHSRVLWMQ